MGCSKIKHLHLPDELSGEKQVLEKFSFYKNLLFPLNSYVLFFNIINQYFSKQKIRACNFRVTPFIGIAGTANQHEIKLFKWLLVALLHTVRP